MPNHVTNVLKIVDAGGVSLADMRKAFLDDKGFVDFDVVLLSPACLRGFEPHHGILSRANAALGLLPDPKKLNGNDIADLTSRLELSNALRDVTTPTRPEDIPNVIRAIENYRACGYMYWYDWNLEHWGTKWNAYGQNTDGHPADATTFKFDTAWSHPKKVIEAISAKLSTVLFEVLYADEDLGSNCGTYTIRAGVRQTENIQRKWDGATVEEKRKWTEFAFRLRYDSDEDPADHGYDQNWEYSDAVYEAHEAKKGGASSDAGAST